MNNLVVVGREILIDLCPYLGGHKECKKKRCWDCAYPGDDCYFDDIKIIFEDDDGYLD